MKPQSKRNKLALETRSKATQEQQRFISSLCVGASTLLRLRARWLAGSRVCFPPLSRLRLVVFPVAPRECLGGVPHVAGGNMFHLTSLNTIILC